MERNVGTIDKVIRVLIAIALVVVGIVGAGAGLWWIAIVALLPLVTAGVGFCPLYRLIGVKTIKVKKL